MSDFLNSNGLVDGKIPAGAPCPFHEVCSIRNDNCPVPGATKPSAFSCAAARAFSMERTRK